MTCLHVAACMNILRLCHGTGKVTVNPEEYWSSQSEVRRFVGPSSPRVVDVHRKSTSASVIGD